MKTQREKYLELALRTIQAGLLEAHEALTVFTPTANRDFDDAVRAINKAIGIAAVAQKEEA